MDKPTQQVINKNRSLRLFKTQNESRLKALTLSGYIIGCSRGGRPDPRFWNGGHPFVCATSSSRTRASYPRIGRYGSRGFRPRLSSFSAEEERAPPLFQSLPMKRLIALVLLIVAQSASADTLAVLSKNQVAVIGPSGAISALGDNPSHKRFITALWERGKQSNDEATLPIVSPPEWGKTLENSGGSVRYLPTFAQGFAGRLSFHGLAPKHTYLLTLNGTPQHPGNERLPDPVPGIPEERFYDFLRIVTDAQGAYESDIGIYLLPGDYHVRIYVKDTDDFKIVLYRDYFDFSVTPELKSPPSNAAPAAAKAP